MSSSSHRSLASIPPPKPAKCGPHSDRTSSVSARTFPTIRLSEDPQHVTIVAIVPGFATEDLDIAVENDVLRITGKLRPQAPHGLPSIRRERTATDFSRAIKLASDVLRSHTEAKLENGVLTVRMPKCGPTDRISIPFRIPSESSKP